MASNNGRPPSNRRFAMRQPDRFGEVMMSAVGSRSFAQPSGQALHPHASAPEGHKQWYSAYRFDGQAGGSGHQERVP